MISLGLRSIGVVFLLAFALGCDDAKPGPAPLPKAPPAASVMAGGGLNPALVAKAVNPSGLPAYAGPTGAVVGRVRLTGDPPPPPTSGSDIEVDCDAARAVHSSLFRVAEGGWLIDALVAVTEYDGFVPPAGESVQLVGKDCHWGRQTLSMTYGQRLEVKSGDHRTYIPELIPSRMGVLFVAAPQRDSVFLTPEKPQSYRVRDGAHPYAELALFVLPYSTHSVTDSEGRFEIGRLPPGKAKVSALLPPTMEAVSQEVTVVAGESVTVELVIQHSAAKLSAAQAPSGAGSAAPSGAGSAAP